MQPRLEHTPNFAVGSMLERVREAAPDVFEERTAVDGVGDRPGEPEHRASIGSRRLKPMIRERIVPGARSIRKFGSRSSATTVSGSERIDRGIGTALAQFKRPRRRVGHDREAHARKVAALSPSSRSLRSTMTSLSCSALTNLNGPGADRRTRDFVERP